MSMWEAIVGSATVGVGVATLATVAALLTISIPFVRGLAVVMRARAATSPDIATASPGAGAGSLGRLLVETLQESLRENEAGHPPAFVRDAARQYVLHEYEEAYARPITMYANLLPPIGFIGTTLGLVALFASMHLADRALEIGALGLALTSTLFALMSYAVLEALKIALHRRLRESLDGVLAYHCPPSTLNTLPVIQAASSEAR